MAAVVVVAVLMAMPLPTLTRPAGPAGVKAGGLHEVGRARSYEPFGHPVVTVHPSGLAPASPLGAGPRAAPAVAGPVAGPLHPTSPQLLSQFAGSTFGTSGGWWPPDAQVGVGGKYVFEMTNEFVRVTSQNGSTVYLHTSSQKFFNQHTTDNIAGGQVIYDGLTNRWFVAAQDYTTNSLLLAVSKNSSPVGGWYQYFFTTTFAGISTYMYNPVAGISTTFFAAASDLFNTTTFAFAGNILVVMNKHKLEAGTLSFTTRAFTDHSVAPARQITANGSGPDVLYALSTRSTSGSTSLDVYEIHGTIAHLSVTAFTLTIANTGTAPSAPQAGNSSLIPTGDDRVQSASWSIRGVLWVSFETACTPSGDGTVRSCVRVDAISTGANVLFQDTDTAVAGEYLYCGALTAFPTGIAYLMVVSYSNSLDYPTIAMTGQNTSDIYTTFRGPVPALSGTSYTSVGRYGDYSGIQFVQTGTKPTAWAAAEYETASGWATEVVHFAFY